MSDAQRLHSSATWMTMSTIAVGGSNFFFAILLVWLLPSRDFAIFAGIQAVLLVAGTIASAAIPWVLARQVALFGAGTEPARNAVSFSILMTILGAIGGALVTALICSQFAGPSMVLPATASAVSIFGAATVIGYLQGVERFRLIAAASLLGATVKVGFGTGLVLASSNHSAAGAVWGFGAGGLATITLGLPRMLPSMRLRVSSIRNGELWRQAINLGAVQGGVAVLGSIDAIVAAGLAAVMPANAAGYQVASTIGRIPVFLAAALSMALYPQLVRGGQRATTLIAVSLSMLLALAVAFAIGAETVPPALAAAVLPKHYGHVTLYLEFTAITGIAVAVVNLTTTYFQAQGRFKSSLKVQIPGIAIQVVAVALGARFGGVIGLAVGAAAGASVSALAMLGLTLRQWPDSRRIGWRPLWVLLACVPIILLAHGSPWLWLGYSAVVGGTVIAITFLKPASYTSKAAATPANLDHLRILHCGYEDFRRPGSGGGSVRTHEIDRRLARTHEVTVLVARYTGGHDRIEDGVRYVHIGMPLGYFPSLLAYFACLPLALRRYGADVVIEDFGAPFSSIAVPLLTKRPVVGMVQWMFAREKAQQYHLPFHWLEKLGVYSHRELITVSLALREDVLRANPRATVHVVPNGLEEAGWATETAESGQLLCLGRLEVAQKGLDRLIEVFSLIAPHTGSELVIAGDGPDLERVRTMVREQGLQRRVRFVGRVTGRAKFDLLASAQLVLVTSRYETFGIVAAEALACRTPVVAFDLPCLREVVPAEAGVLVAQGDVAAFAAVVLNLLADGDRRHRMGDAGRAFSLRFNWDAMADKQEEILREVVRAHPLGFSARARLRWLLAGR